MVENSAKIQPNGDKKAKKNGASEADKIASLPLTVAERKKHGLPSGGVYFHYQLSA